MNLELLKVLCWLPRYSKVQRQRSELRFVERQLLPGYLFVAFPRGAPDWNAVRNAGGVHGVIAADGAPVRVPNEDVSDLMVRCLTGRFDEGQRRVGSKVHVVEGKHAGTTAWIVKAPVDEMVTVLLRRCGAPTFGEVSLDQLRIAA